MNNLMETLKEAGVLEYIDVVERDLEPVFERFAALVAAKAAEKERETCAKTAESLDDWVNDPYETATIREIAALIRARGNSEN